MISKTFLATLFAACIALSLATLVYAGPVYKWSDEGRVIYSQTPPAPGIEFEVVYQDDTGTNTSVAKAETDSSDDFDKRREARIEKNNEKQVQEESDKIKAENCAIATKNMQSLTSRGQVTVKDGDTYRRLSEEERQAQIQQTQEQVSEYCS